MNIYNQLIIGRVNMWLCCSRDLVTCLYLFVLCCNVSARPKKWQVQLDKQTISDHNDTTYVRKIMQLAKSAEMQSYMDTSLNSCDNFYEFACGNWPKVNPATIKYDYKTNMLGLLNENYNQLQLSLLRNADDNKKEEHYFSKIKTFFQSCLRWENTHLFRKKLRSIISEFGSMPALSLEGGWEEDTFDWIETLAKIQNKYGIDIIFGLAIYRDFVAVQNDSKVYIGPAKLALETKSMYTSEETHWIRENYKEAIKNNLNAYLSLPVNILDATANDILDLEIQLSYGIADFREEKAKTTYELRTINYLNKTYGPAIDFQHYFNIAIGSHFNDSVYELMPEFQTNFLQVLKKSSKSQLANYINYQLVNAFLPVVINMTPLEKEKTCLQKTRSHFSKPLDVLTYNNFSNKDTKHDVELMWQKLKENFKQELDLKKITWMSDNTTELALTKLEAMRLEMHMDEKKNFTQSLASLNISRIKTFLDNLQAVFVFETQNNFKNLDSSPDEMELPQTQMPSYITTENLIKIPVSLLQPNFFWSDHYPEALRYGTLGFLLAHELMHGFDDVGRYFNAKGNIELWWDSNTSESFDERRKCFQNQYRRFRYNGKYLPDSELQTENIADNAAVKLAYSAYVSFLMEVQAISNDLDRAEILEMEQLPNLNLSNRQLFFLAYAQFWCVDVNEKLKDFITYTDTHAPEMFRVIGAMSNFDEFATAFQCSKGSTMNPEEKCHIY